MLSKGVALMLLSRYSLFCFMDLAFCWRVFPADLLMSLAIFSATTVILNRGNRISLFALYSQVLCEYYSIVFRADYRTWKRL